MESLEGRAKESGKLEPGGGQESTRESAHACEETAHGKSVYEGGTLNLCPFTYRLHPST